MTSDGHFRKAMEMGSPVLTLGFFAGIDFASTTPRRLSGLPPMQEGDQAQIVPAAFDPPRRRP